MKDGFFELRGGFEDRTRPSVDSGVGAGQGNNDRVFRVGGGVSPPALIHKVDPEYTEQARAANLQGTVILYVEIGGWNRLQL
jgi:periplasmic protein TonB